MNRITITTYDEMHQFVAAFGADRINMLVICSRGGLGKRVVPVSTLAAMAASEAPSSGLVLALPPAAVLFRALLASSACLRRSAARGVRAVCARVARCRCRRSAKV